MASRSLKLQIYIGYGYFKKAQEAATEVLRRDKLLREEENIKLKGKIVEKFKGKLKDISLN